MLGCVRAVERGQLIGSVDFGFFVECVLPAKEEETMTGKVEGLEEFVQGRLNILTLKCYDINDAWFTAVRSALERGKWRKVTDGSFKGTRRRELDYLTLQVSYPGVRPLSVQLSPGCPVPAPVDSDFIDRYLDYLIGEGKEEGESYTYGEFIAQQMPVILDKFKKGGFGTNQCCIMVGDCESVRLADPPCLRVIDMRVDNGVLHWFLYFRSWDLWGGLPANLAGLQLLKEWVAAELGVFDGEIIASSKGAHVYDMVAEKLMDYYGLEEGD